MIHIRIDDEPDNSKRRFECGIGPQLPPGDRWVFVGEHPHLVDCPGCLHGQPPMKIGTPARELSGRPGHNGYEKFCQIAQSWGYP